MSKRRPARFTQADLTRALKAVRASGITATVKVDIEGNLIILPGTPSEPIIDRSWDKAIAELESRR